MEVLPQDMIIDQIFSYSIQAGETLQQNFFKYAGKDRKYTNLLLPYGPDLYTGPLKAAGYLLLDESIKTVILIKEMKEKKDKSKLQNTISIYEGSDIVLLGKKINTTLTKYPKNIKKVKNIDQEILNQFFFLRLIRGIDNIICLEVGKDVNDDEFLDTIAFFSKNNDCGIVLFDTCSNKVPVDEGKKIDEYMIKQIYLQKINKKNNWLGNKFVSLNKQNNKKPEIVGYLNTGDFGDNLLKSTGYVCMVA